MKKLFESVLIFEILFQSTQSTFKFNFSYYKEFKKDREDTFSKDTLN